MVGEFQTEQVVGLIAPLESIKDRSLSSTVVSTFPYYHISD
uniref:Uncharacterized protein n=1 Tax=Arundo donax TaxID=35708 RepID=A0A0A9BFS3_ARUDO